MMMAMVAEVVEQEELAVVGIVLVVEMVVLDRGLAGSPHLVGCVFCQIRYIWMNIWAQLHF